MRRELGQISRHPLGGALRASEEPPESRVCAGLERLWPGTFCLQIENVGSAYRVDSERYNMS
jgi:hypothetical protein